MGLANTQTFLENEIKYILQRDRSLKLSFWFIVNKITCGKCCNTREVQLLRKATRMVVKDLDVFTILDKLK